MIRDFVHMLHTYYNFSVFSLQTLNTDITSRLLLMAESEKDKQIQLRNKRKSGEYNTS